MNHGRSHVVKHKPLCMCGAVGVRSERYDSYYCPESRVWLERAPEEGSGFEGRPDTAADETP